MNFIKSDIKDNKITINNASFELNEEQKTKLSGRNTVLTGIRAESLTDLNSNFEFKANVDIKEMLGSEQIVYFSANGKNCGAIVPPSLNIEKEITFKINTDNLHFFDPETGMKI